MEQHAPGERPRRRRHRRLYTSSCTAARLARALGELGIGRPKPTHNPPTKVLHRSTITVHRAAPGRNARCRNNTGRQVAAYGGSWPRVGALAGRSGGLSWARLAPSPCRFEPDVLWWDGGSFFYLPTLPKHTTQEARWHGLGRVVFRAGARPGRTGGSYLTPPAAPT